MESIPGLLKRFKIPYLPLYLQIGIDREANIRGGGKPVHVVVLLGSESSLDRKGAAELRGRSVAQQGTAYLRECSVALRMQRSSDRCSVAQLNAA